MLLHLANAHFVRTYCTIPYLYATYFRGYSSWGGSFLEGRYRKNGRNGGKKEEGVILKNARHWYIEYGAYYLYETEKDKRGTFQTFK